MDISNTYLRHFCRYPEANENKKKGENDRHEGAQPVEKRYRRIITLAHLTMIAMILEMQTKANSLFGSN